MNLKPVAFADIPAAYDRYCENMLDRMMEEQARLEWEEEYWDAIEPNWRELSLDPEDRRYIS